MKRILVLILLFIVMYVTGVLTVAPETLDNSFANPSTELLSARQTTNLFRMHSFLKLLAHRIRRAVSVKPHGFCFACVINFHNDFCQKLNTIEQSFVCSAFRQLARPFSFPTSIFPCFTLKCVTTHRQTKIYVTQQFLTER